MKYHFLKIFKVLALCVLGISILFGILFIVTALITEPSNTRDWNIDQKILPRIIKNGNEVTIENIRNFSYTSPTDYTPSYYTKTFNLEDIQRVWYVVEPFSGIPGSAHTLLSFEFADGDDSDTDNDFLAISVEIRKEKGEAYHPFRGLFNAYELMYVIADERDVIKLRSNYRKDLVYVYPVKADPEKVQKLFLSMLDRAEQLQRSPEFYNTLTNTCTTNIVHHVNMITPRRVPFFNLRILLPANSDHLAYELGLLDTQLPFEQAREKFLINERAHTYADAQNFSIKIRE